MVLLLLNIKITLNNEFPISKVKKKIKVWGWLKTIFKKAGPVRKPLTNLKFILSEKCYREFENVIFIRLSLISQHFTR